MVIYAHIKNNLSKKILAGPFDLKLYSYLPQFLRGLGLAGCKLKGGFGVCSITALCVWPAISSPPLGNRHFRHEAQQPNKDCHGGEEVV